MHIVMTLISTIWTPPFSRLFVLRGSVVARPGDLELAQRTLAVFDDAVREFDDVQLDAADQEVERQRMAVYANLVLRVADQLSNLGDSRHALAVAAGCNSAVIEGSCSLGHFHL